MADKDLYPISDEFLKLGNQETIEEVSNQIKATEDEVKYAAYQVVSYSEFLKNQWIQTQKYTSIGKNEDPNQKILQFQKKMIQTKEQYKKMMTYVLNLQNKINSFLGQEIQMIYTFISPNGTVEIYKFDNTIDHLSISRTATSRGGNISGRIRFSVKELKNLEKLSPMNNYNPESLNTTFQEVYSRYVISKTKLNMRGAFYIFWKTNGHWEGSRVTSVGVLGEAYFNFFINEYLFSSFIEEAVKDYMTNSKYGVNIADSISGFLQGDVSKNGIEYGVKAAGASALGYTDIIKYANEIYTTSDLMTYLVGVDGKSGLKQVLIEKGSQNLAREVLSEEMDNVIIQDILNELIQQGKGNISLQY